MLSVRWWRRVDAGLVVACCLGLLALWPLLRRGYVLSYDMVFVPRPPLTPALLGLGSAVARAVPSDAIVALLARALPADIVQKAILLGVFTLGGWGAARLVPSAHPAAHAAAAAFYTWNAYVYERLLLGHWTLLVSYAALPWAVRAALDLRGDRGAWPRVVVALAVASFASASGGLVATGTALLVTAGAARRWLVAAAGVILALPWLLPSLLRPGGLPARPAGVEAFAAAADTRLGVLGSLLTLGGGWNEQVIPPGRDLLAVAPALLLLLGLALAGVPALWRRWGPGLLVAAAIGLLLGLAGALPGLSDGLRALVTALPGAGLLRDGQRYLGPLALLQALGFGLTVERLGRWRAPLAVAALAPVLVLPVLAGGAAGRLAAVAYPPAYAQARAAMAQDREAGAVLVLPWSAYIAPSYNGGQPLLDPAQRWFARRTIASQDLVVGDIVLPAEDLSATPTGDVRYVLVNKLGPWQRDARRLAGLEVVVDSPALRLYRAPPPQEVTYPAPPAAPVVAGTALAAALALAAAGRVVAGRREVRR